MPTNPDDLFIVNLLGNPLRPIVPAATDSDETELCEHCGGDADECATCNACSECIEDTDTRDGSDGNTYCEPCFDDRFFDCADCEEVTARRRYGNSQNADGDYICDDCSCHYDDCAECGNRFHQENMIYRESRDSTYCMDCDPGEYGEDFEANHFPTRSTDTFDRIGSRRTFGIELETSECDGYHDLAGDVYFGACEDGSIRGMEFVSAVLHGDAGLDAVTDFCNRANRMGFKVDSSCGFHLHIGCKDLSDGQLYAVAAAYHIFNDIWRSFVVESRRRNSYCGDTDWTATDCLNAWNDGEEFRYFADKDRYQWLNLAAYTEHKTFEVRLHTATLNAEKANNWVMAHLRFVDAMSKLSIGEVMRRYADGSPSERFARLAGIIGSDLADYYRDRAREFGTVYSTRARRLRATA